MAAQDHMTHTQIHTHSFGAKDDATHPHVHTPSSVIHYYQRAKLTAVTTESWKMPCSVVWSECSFLLFSWHKSWPKLHRKAKNWRYGPSQRINCGPGASVTVSFSFAPWQIFYLLLSLVFVGHNLKHLCQLAGQRAAGVLQQTARNKGNSGWSQLLNRKQASEATAAVVSALALEIERFPWEKRRESEKTPASPSSQACCPT